MTTDRDNAPEHVTFSQRHGYKPLPEPMRLEEISKDLRREVWNVIFSRFRDNLSSYGNYFKQDMVRIIQRTWGRFWKIPENRVPTDVDSVERNFESTVIQGRFNLVLDILEIMIDELHSVEFAKRIKNLFNEHGAAYWLDISNYPYRFVPCANAEQAKATRRDIETIREGDMDSAANHLRAAVVHINFQQYADAITDSIHAVESVARKIDPRSSSTLGPALKSLEKAGILRHPALRQAFEKLYGYTNDEQGIRHALLDKDTADVGLDEALFMFGACASFAAYLTQKHRQADHA